MGEGEEDVEREGGEEGRGEGVGITWEFLAKYRSHYEDIESKQHCSLLSHEPGISLQHVPFFVCNTHNNTSSSIAMLSIAI